MQKIKEIIDLIDKSIKTDPNNLITWWNIIKDGFNDEVDEHRDLIQNANEWLSNYTSKLIEETWISKLKIKYTWNAGYFIEVPKTQMEKVSDNFVHKTTLVNAVRYITEELKDFENKVINCESFLAEKEYELFKEVSNNILENFGEIKTLWQTTANIDYISNLSYVSYENNYVKPEMSSKYDLEIQWGRHPIIEKIEKEFIQNDLTLTSDKFTNIITWPNMWWKSTYLRQNALIILFSHIWCFVPAKKAIIPVTDKIFSRVWASDNLFLWNSTFMVEMQEMANILNNSTRNSFVIVDEVWRWTSTFDGMSLAWAILKQNHDNIKAKTLFATHYHELVDESKKLEWVANYCVAVWENEDNIVFLRKIIPGSIKKSYWIEVAKIAGLPSKVIDEAYNFLETFENTLWWASQLSLWIAPREKIKYIEKDSIVEKQLKELDVNNMTPIDAFNMILKLKNKVK